MQADDRFAGKRVRCRKCGQAVQVPGEHVLHEVPYADEPPAEELRRLEMPTDEYGVAARTQFGRSPRNPLPAAVLNGEAGGIGHGGHSKRTDLKWAVDCDDSSGLRPAPRR
jgi:hypothetical protein